MSNFPGGDFDAKFRASSPAPVPQPKPGVCVVGRRTLDATSRHRVRHGRDIDAQMLWLTLFAFGLAKSVIISSILFPKMSGGRGTPPGVLTVFADWRREWVFWGRQSANPSSLG